MELTENGNLRFLRMYVLVADLEEKEVKMGEN